MKKKFAVNVLRTVRTVAHTFEITTFFLSCNLCGNGSIEYADDGSI